MPGKGKTSYYFPSRDADIVPWTRNFVAVLASGAQTWGIAEALVAALDALGAAYEEAFNRRLLPDSGRVSVEQKNLARAALKEAVRDMVNGHIRYNKAVTPDDWVALGLTPPNTSRSPIPAPVTTVVLRAAAGLVRQLVVHFTDSAAPGSRARPYGVLGMELAWAVLASPPAGVDELIRRESAATSPLAVIFREEDRGKMVYMAGRWAGSRETRGPWSGIVSAIIP
jgi:hypothetical protein